MLCLALELEPAGSCLDDIRFISRWRLKTTKRTNEVLDNPLEPKNTQESWLRHSLSSSTTMLHKLYVPRKRTTPQTVPHTCTFHPFFRIARRFTSNLSLRMRLSSKSLLIHFARITLCALGKQTTHYSTDTDGATHLHHASLAKLDDLLPNTSSTTPLLRVLKQVAPQARELSVA